MPIDTKITVDLRKEMPGGPISRFAVSFAPADAPAAQDTVMGWCQSPTLDFDSFDAGLMSEVILRRAREELQAAEPPAPRPADELATELTAADLQSEGFKALRVSLPTTNPNQTKSQLQNWVDGGVIDALEAEQLLVQAGAMVDLTCPKKAA